MDNLKQAKQKLWYESRQKPRVEISEKINDEDFEMMTYLKNRLLVVETHHDGVGVSIH